MIFRMLIPLLLLIILPDLYIYFCCLKGTPREKLSWWEETDPYNPPPRRPWLNAEQQRYAWIYWIPSVVLILLLTTIFLTRFQHESFFQWVFAITLCLSIPKLVFTLFSLLLCRGLGYPLPEMRKPGEWIALLAAAFVLCILLHGFLFGWQKLTVKREDKTFFQLPRNFNGYTIVQFSDLHAGTLSNHPEFVEKAVEKINSLHPDMIVFTGDLVNGKASELDPFMEILSRLKAPDGVYSVLGNHDYGLYGHFNNDRERAENLRDLIERQRRMGWQLLLNENRIIRRYNDSIAIVGVENDGRPPFPSRGDLPRATAGLQPGCFKILLSHDPTHWRRKVLPETDIQLTFSGHTHGTQFKVGYFSPAQWVYDEWGGLYTEKDRALYVSLGLGEVMFPFRFGAWPEINVFTLYSAMPIPLDEQRERKAREIPIRELR